MDKEGKKKRIGQAVAFYGALAVCLLAVGVGTWELFQPQERVSGTAAVSLPATLPDVTPEPPELPDVTPEPPELPDVPASVAAVADADSGETSADSGKSKSDSGKTAGDSGKSASDSGKTAGDSGKSASDSGKSKSDSGKSKSDSGKTAGDSGKSKSDSGKTAGDSGKSKSDGGKSAAGTKSSRPVDGVVVTSYSMDQLIYNETMRDWRTHDGVDIAADAGTAVVAARAGTVESVAADPIMGMTVVIRHDDGWGSVYASLADVVEVEAGDEVSAGQVIGFTGETAASEAALGPHLHFSVLRDGTPVDPESFGLPG